MPVRTHLAAGGACLALAVGLAATVAPEPAAAQQEYAKKEGKDCSFCHVNAKGSGPRNAKGQEYEANGHLFGVQSWTSDAHRDRFLRACSALNATWYGEAGTLLDALAKDEKLHGGRALVLATRARFSMFPRVWLRGAKTLLAKGDRGLPNALVFLAKLESQFAGTDEGKEAVRLLDEAARPASKTESRDGSKDDAKAKAVEEARAVEKVRVLVLRGRTEWDQGDAAAAKKLFDQALADPRGKVYEGEIGLLLAESPEK